jgi:phosphoribosylamine--glycine ligase
MKILIVGSGGREHALAWSLSRSLKVKQVYVASGNAGTQWQGGNADTFFAVGAPCQNIAVASHDIPSLINFAQDHAIDLTIVGPEVPLALGIVNDFQEANLKIFGPNEFCAQLESSKAFCKDFMTEQGIPTAPYIVVDNEAVAYRYILEHDPHLVVKANGLAAGKGVIMCDTRSASRTAVHQMLAEKAFGEAGERVILEDRLVGREISVLAFCDGKTAKPMLVARDHKRALDGDKGLNTGGMGAIAPAPDIDQSLIDDVMRRVVQPALQGMANLENPYVGVLYAGIMLTENDIQVLEFNCRLGDPETQVILPLLKTDLADILWACVQGTLDQITIEWHDLACATVVLASQGYPSDYPKGLPISGLDHTPENAIVFHAGTSQKEGIVTNGGRVLSVTAVGKTLDDALNTAYACVDGIHFEGMHYRRDIGRTTQHD